MQISSTTFIDFLFKPDISKVAFVRQTRRRYEQPFKQGMDYYGRLRDGMISVLRDGADLSILDAVVEEAPSNRRDNYEACIAGFRRWLASRQGIVWVRRPKMRLWTRGALEVRLNPELLVNVDGKPHRVKLYVQGTPKLSQRRANLLIHLLGSEGSDGDNIGVLDVRRGRLFAQTVSSPDFDTLLDAGASTFVTLWHAVGGQAGQRPAAL
jgi:hypothetical protein